MPVGWKNLKKYKINVSYGIQLNTKLDSKLRYSKTKARERRLKLQNLEEALTECAEMRFRSKYKKYGGTRGSSDGI